MMVLKKNGTVGYTDINILPYYVDEIEYCVIELGNKLKGPMCVLDTPKHLLSVIEYGELDMDVSCIYLDGDYAPIDEMEYARYTFHSNILEEWYSILPIIDQFILLNEFFEQHLTVNAGVNIGTVTLLEKNREPDRYAISFWMDECKGYQEIINKKNRTLFDNVNRFIFNCRIINTPDLDERNDFITISKNRWRFNNFETGGPLMSKTSKNITRTCMKFISDRVDYIIYPVSPSISYLLTLADYIRYENIMRMRVTLTDEYPDTEGTSNDINIPSCLERHLQLGMTLNNYLSIMNDFVFNPLERQFYPGLYLELERCDTLKKYRHRTGDSKNISISVSKEFLYKNKCPLFTLINAMIEEVWEWR